jgi:superfamily I DNA/RNA helicase
MLNPDDDVSLLRIANVPARGLSDVTMERLLGASHERKCSVFAVMKNPAVTATFQAKSRESIEHFVDLIQRTQGRLQAESLSRDPHALQTLVSHFLEEVGYIAELRRMEKNPETAESRIRNLKELTATLDGAEAVSQAPFDRLQAFLEQITLDSELEEEEDEAQGDAVTLITMHSCKGLEFPSVYIVGLEDGLLPHSRSKVEGTLDEERRLFYVAITRAMQSLSISHCACRKKYGSLVPCHPSPFLKELPPEFVEHADEKGKRPVTPASGKQFFATLRGTLD